MYQACMNFASSYLPETIELVRWMIDMNLDFQNTTRLETVDPVEMMVRGSLELGVEAIISIRFDERNFAGFRRLVTSFAAYRSGGYRAWVPRRGNADDDSLPVGIGCSTAGELDPVLLSPAFPLSVPDDASRGGSVGRTCGVLSSLESPNSDEVARVGSRLLGQEQWGNYFSKYTEGYYEGDAIIYNYVHGTMMIKKLFEDDVIGKAGLQYLVAWSIYRQLAEFTEPYLFRGDRTAEESCFVHVKNVMRLAVLSNYFNTEATEASVLSRERAVDRIPRLVNSWRTAAWIKETAGVEAPGNVGLLAAGIGEHVLAGSVTDERGLQREGLVRLKERIHGEMMRRHRLSRSEPSKSRCRNVGDCATGPR
ncbi:hypothetical protein HPB51_027188 [Rhipicephalus microplus]|uniref:Uncharacterized protein n=1 Tax=Rhipicephalus microplus TaxID=6941 RepID=A0A9J6D0W6_RHIMP|nr:hypothetical protein HPB51_027188 [Rhipicephalus microplus]